MVNFIRNGYISKMKTHELEITNYQTPGEVVRFLNKHDVKRGDTLKVSAEDEKQNITVMIFAVVVMALIMFYNQKKKREEEGEKILDTLFKESSTIEEIEKEVEKEYGIKIQVETKTDEEREFWYKLSSQGLAKAYSIDEPDYTEADVKEPNPDYKPCKKDK